MHNILVIQTQDMENKAWPTWDGNGDCPQAWRYKGGSTYIHYADNNQTAYDFNNITSIIDSLNLTNNEAFREYVIETKYHSEDSFWEFIEETDDYWVQNFRVIHSNGNIEKWGK